MVRKRKPGGGRKPIYGKTSTFSTRITAETRGALEAEAAEARPRQSISQAAERLLRLGLEVKRNRELDDPVRALGYVIRTIAEFCKSTTKDGRDCDWRNDPAVFEAFRFALGTFLERLRPPGKIDTSAEGPLVGRSPEQHGEAAFRLIWNFLQTRIEPRSRSEIEASVAHIDSAFTVEAITAISAGAAAGEYAMLNVQRALGIKFEETNK
jgi:hypothetical protein